MKAIFTPSWALRCLVCGGKIHQEFIESIKTIGLKHDDDDDSPKCEHSGKLYRMPVLEIEEVRE